MRRCLRSPPLLLRCWWGGARDAATLSSLINCQTQLRLGNKKKIDAEDASNYAEFFNIPISLDSGIAASTAEHFEGIQKKIEAEQEARIVREQEQEQQAKGYEDLAVFLSGYDFKKKTFYFFSIAEDRVVHTYKKGDDSWELAGDMMKFTRQSPQLVLIPVVESDKELRIVKPLMDELASAMRSSGLQPVCHVDAQELAQCFAKNPPSSSSVLVHNSSSKGTVVPVSLSDQWFRAHWVSLRTLACKASELDPMTTINTYIFPRYDVFVVHLVRAGSRGMNISICDPVRKRRFHGKGMLSDMIACLLETRSKNLIIIPTNRTDRATLMRCRSALHKAGCQCLLVFASEMDEKYRKVFHSDPLRYWDALKMVNSTLGADLVFQVYVTAGTTLRTYQKKRMKEAEVLGADSVGAIADGGDDDDADADNALVSSTDVDVWLKCLNTSKRRAAEHAEARRYTKYLAVAYTSTGFLAHGQPRNPTAAVNYVLSTCWVDAKGKVLEPWSVFTSRGQCTLPALTDVEVLVVHNAKEFMLLLWDDAELQAFIKRGGRVWCTMLAEYLLSGQRCKTGSNDINDVALRHGFLLPDHTKVGVPADRLPLTFHRKHLMQAAPAVAAVFKRQLDDAQRQSQLLSVSHRMDSLLAMACMEWSGIRIDVEEAARQAKSIRNEAVVLDRLLSACVPPEVPMDMREYFDWQSTHHLRAFFFGGAIAIGQGDHARASSLWTSNLVHLCHRYGPFRSLVGELHLQRFATEQSVAPTNSSLPRRIATHIEKAGTDKTTRYRLVLFDIETTGLNASTDEIIEVAMFDPVEKTSFTSLINPKRPISPVTVDIHHITDAAVKDAPTMERLMPSMLEYLRLDSASRDPNEVLILMGHNVFGVDEPMLRRAFISFAPPETEHDGILFCDSLTMLRALKVELQDSRLRKKHVDNHLLETLTTSLRLGKLIENLRVTPEGQLHRADTDTKALWFVMVNAFGVVGQDAEKQRDTILGEAAKTLLLYPAVGCFVPTERKRNNLQVNLPGVTHGRMHSKVVSSLKSKPLNEAVLEALQTRGIEAAGYVLKRMRLDRHTSRFLQSGGPDSQQLSALHADMAVHQHIDMTATTTSRTTSSYPSCQNIPKDDKSSVRRLFVSRFGAKGRCVEVDYSQLEIVILAILCKDAALTRDLKRGVDFHVKRAEFFSGLPYKEIHEGYKRGVAKYVKLRKTAKQFSFQRLYGAGVPLLHKTTAIPVKDLEQSIRMEDKEYPSIAKFHRMTRSVALRPNNPGLPTSFIVEMPTGMRTSFKTRDVILNLPPVKNYPIQGYGAELAQMMVGRLFRHFTKKNFYGNKACLINFVHDSVWLDCHVDVLEECVRDTCRILSDVHRYVPKKFPGVDICVPLQVSASCGVDMCSMENINDDDYSFIANQKRSTVDPNLSLDDDEGNSSDHQHLEGELSLEEEA